MRKILTIVTYSQMLPGSMLLFPCNVRSKVQTRPGGKEKPNKAAYRTEREDSLDWSRLSVTKLNSLLKEIKLIHLETDGSVKI